MGRPLQHRRRIKMALVAALALDVGVALVTTGVASAAPPAAPRASDSTVATAKAKAFATLKILKDGASVRRKGKTAFKAAHDGQKLRVGDTIQTDATGEAEIDYTLSANSFTRLDNQGHRQVEGSLDSGRTWNRTSALTESESFSQDGAGATASVVGSAFMAECDTSGHCTFTSVVDGLKLVTVDGEVKLLTPLEGCDSTEVDPTNATLCGVPTEITADVLAANAWIQQNLFFDGKAGFPGPTFTATIVVTNGQVTSVTPTPPPADNTPAPTSPDAPTGASAVAGDGTATVSWSAPASDGGRPITEYTVTALNTTSLSVANVGPTCPVGGDETSCTVTGLTNGDSYTFTVTATNEVGTSPASAPSNQVFPAGAPDAPTAPTATLGDPGSGAVTVSWTAPASNGSNVTGYTVTGSPGGSCIGGATDTSCLVSGLTFDQAYTFTVVANSSDHGDSGASGASNSVTPLAAPPVIDQSTPINVTGQDFQSSTPPTPTGNSSGLTVEDEHKATTFTINSSDPNSSAVSYYLVFTNLNLSTAGHLYDGSNAAVDTATHYAPATVFKFSANELEIENATLTGSFTVQATNTAGSSSAVTVPVTVTEPSGAV